jgi:hypothetical protein
MTLIGAFPMTNIYNLLNQIAQDELQLQSTRFLAPCVKGGRVRTRVAGMVYTFTPAPRSFEGWGIFQPLNAKIAKLIKEADLPQIVVYLQHLPPIRLWLADRLHHQTWLAFPVNAAEMHQRFQVVRPVQVHLVTEGHRFGRILARWSGGTGWFEDIDRRADPMISEQLQKALKIFTPVEELQFKGITPEIRSLYELVMQRTEGFPQPRRDEQRLRQALRMGGGQLVQFQDRGDYWTVDWTTVDQTHHTSAIAKDDLTVVSSGICLSGRDQDFDLQSLVGVMEGQEW